MDKIENSDWLRKRLDAIILLLLEASPMGAGTMTRKIERLIELGFTQAEVGQVVGKKLNYVTAVVANKKKSPTTKDSE